ncbi:hypothetical protein [Streptomyces sp. NPDC048111]|uniref:hypothetical protein n=1 Tax=Streptomyces sp. NPDC048111 TaxID=3365500 RepID=UPI0037244D38
MTNHSDDIARADRLARLLSDARGAEILAELHKGRGRPTRTPRPAGAAAEAPRVGVWDLRPGPDGVELHRHETDPGTARLWAEAHHVPGKGSARRVAVLGESTARGFLLDPAVTPTGVLQRALDDADERAQCVDLAKTGASITELGAVISRLDAVDADAVVLLAGNNWSLQNLTVTDHDRLADALRAGGLAGLRDTFAHRVVRPRVRALLRRLQEVADRRPGLDVVVVVPEFNLTEWRPDPAWDTGVLPAERAAEWSVLRAQTQEAQDQGRWHDVLAPAARMAELDEGTSPVPGWALGRAHEALGDFAAARAAWERSRDAVSGLLVAHTPRVTTLIQDELRAFAERGHHALVDLRTELAAPDTGLPDPAHFLDYCHLSPAGTVTAMRAVARALRGGAGGEQGSPRTELPGTARERAMGNLIAACHNARHGQPAEVLHRLVTNAFAEDPGVRDDAADLLSLLAKGVPAWLTPEYDRLCARPNAERYLTSTALDDFATLAGTPLTGVLARALGRSVPPLAGASQDLLAGRLDSAPQLVHGPEGAYFRSASPRFRAPVRLDRAEGMRLRLNYRTPHAEPDARPGTVTLDGRVLAPVAPCTQGWAFLEVDLPAGEGDGPYGELVVSWPAARHDEETWRQEAARTLATGRIPLPVPVFGDLFEARLFTESARVGV